MSGPRVTILGSGGRLGRTLADQWSGRFALDEFRREQWDLARLEEIESRVAALQGGWLVNCAGMTSLEACEEDPALADAVNVKAVEILARACARHGIRFVHFSTDYVFDGSARAPYRETDTANPLGVYGRSKLEGEQAALAAGPGHFVFRVSWVFGPGRPAFPDAMIRKALETDAVEAVCDKWACPTSAADVGQWLATVFDSDPATGGLFHLCNAGVCTWQEYAQHALDAAVTAGLDLRARSVGPVPLAKFGALSAPRPAYSALDTGKFQQVAGIALRPWQEALTDYVASQYSTT